MRMKRSMLAAALVVAVWIFSAGCEPAPKPYGVEARLRLPSARRQIWAVAPAINLSGEKGPDPLLQADLLYQQLQQVQGLTVVPVNRVVEMYAGLKIDGVKSAEQANLICDLLGCDGLVVPTVTIYDPYDPPKLGASLQLFRKPRDYVRPASIDPREIARSSAPTPGQSLPQQPGFAQAVGMFDSANGSVRAAVLQYAEGRHDPQGPMGPREYLLSMDRYCGFAYNALTADLLRSIQRDKSGVMLSRAVIPNNGSVDER